MIEALISLAIIIALWRAVVYRRAKREDELADRWERLAAQERARRESLGRR